jgi:diadenylate cyclase
MEGIRQALLESAGELTKKLGAKALVITEELSDEEIPAVETTVILVGSTFDVEDKRVKRVSIPQNLDLNSILNLISAFLIEHGVLSEGDVFVYVTKDSIGVRAVKKSLSAMKSFFAQNQNVLQRMLEIAIELSIEGREGSPVGTIFVIGDSRRVLRHSHQLIPNPFKGHKINVLDRDTKEIIKEFAQLDGAFIIRDDGRIVAAGRYLEVEPRVIDLMLPPGLGSRHIAAAGITKITNAMAITLSESGTIRIFKNGLMLLEYNPRLKY